MQIFSQIRQSLKITLTGAKRVFFWGGEPPLGGEQEFLVEKKHVTFLHLLSLGFMQKIMKI